MAGVLDFFKRGTTAAADAKPKKDASKPERNHLFGNKTSTNPYTGGFFKNYVGAIPNPNQVLTYEHSKAGVGYTGSPIDLITETVEKDPKIMGLLKSRVGNVLQLESAIRQYNDSTDAETASRLIDRAGEHVGSWHQLEEEMLERGISHGLSYHEMTWDLVKFPLEMGERPRVKEWLIPTAFRQIAANRIGFDAQGRLMIYARFSDGEDPASFGYTASDSEVWWYPHPLAVIGFTRFRQNENPYGYPLMACLFYKAWFKRLMDKWWAQFNENNAEPLHWAEVDLEANLSDDDITALEEIMEGIQRATDAIMPPGVKLHQMELGGSAVSTFQQIIANFDDQAAILITGQTSTSSSARQGSGAQSEVHERNALAIYSSDARCLEATMNKLFKLIVMVNDESLQYSCPFLNINTRSVDEVVKWTQVLKAGLEAGAEIPTREFFRITGIDQRIGTEKILVQAPAPYAKGFGGAKPPSQQTPAKTAAKAGERDAKKPPASQAQPKPAAGK